MECVWYTGALDLVLAGYLPCVSATGKLPAAVAARLFLKWTAASILMVLLFRLTRILIT